MLKFWRKSSIWLLALMILLGPGVEAAATGMAKGAAASGNAIAPAAAGGAPGAGIAAGGVLGDGSAAGGELAQGRPPATAEQLRPSSLIRFHVLANSDSEEDQALKWAVRDALLTELAPRLAQARSVEDSRRIVQDMRPVMEDIAAEVIRNWGKDYAVHTEYGKFAFPTKSYGSLVLPAGDYEALRVVIGRGAGSNWWCVLFPPLCFVDITHATAVPVDGKPGVPIQPGFKSGSKSGNSLEQAVGPQAAGRKGSEQAAGQRQEKRPQVRFWLWDKLWSLLAYF